MSGLMVRCVSPPGGRCEPARVDAWNQGEAYEAYIGRWSRLVARSFLSWLGAADGQQWIDVGCGTGALSQTLLDVARPRSVLGVDPSEGFVAFARRAIADPRARFEVADARALPCADSGVDAAVSGLVINFVSEPARMVAEMARVVRAGGVAAAYAWDYAGEMQFLRRFWDVAIELDPQASRLDEGARFPVCHPDALAALWRSSALERVEVRAIDVPTAFRDFDDFWAPFLGGQGPAPGYCMSLDARRRETLRERLRSRLPVAADGSIELVARAWAVRGQRR